jgi:large subunit ribosomal protein L32
LYCHIKPLKKSKVTRSRKGQRRSHDSLKAKTLSIDPVSGEKHLRHQMTKDGFYKGRLIKGLRKPIKEESEEVTS